MTLSQGDVDEAVLFAKVTVVAANYHIFTEVTQNFKSKDIFLKKSKIFFQFDFENRIHGANFLAYPPVVAGGNRANTLHYINNNQIIKVKDGAECVLSYLVQ